MNFSQYRAMADNPDFWEIVGLDNIIEFLESRDINYLIYCIGEARAANMTVINRPVIMIELYPEEERMKVMRYYATYQLFSMQLEPVR